jgi:predicted SnoaL-like aldol condensation-catalyzing enzyme
MSTTETETNKAVVTEWLNLLVNEKRPAEAVEKFIGPVYRQHAFGQPDGADHLPGAMADFYAANPGLRTTINLIVAEGDLVAAHHHMQLSDDHTGIQVMDLFRLKDGKLIEHWDVVAPIPDGDPGDTPVF